MIVDRKTFLKNSVYIGLVVALSIYVFGDKINVVEAKPMIQTDKKEVAPSKWGGEGIELKVEEDNVVIEYDCAEAEISKKLMIDKKGNFSIEGTYLRKSPGGIRLKFKPKPQPAKFEGKITDKKMTLKVTLKESEELIGKYSLVKNKSANLRRCK